MQKKIISLLIAILTICSVKAQIAIEWTDVVGGTVDSVAQTLTKTNTNGWNNAGARSINRLEKNEDGKLTYTITDLTDRKAIGLSTKNKNQKIKSIDYALVFNKNKVNIFERGRFKGNFGQVKVGDILEIERIGNQIYFRKNGKQIKKRITNPKHRLFVDVTIFTEGSSISNLEASFFTPIKVDVTKQQITCKSGSNGSIDISPKGGKPPYTFSWSNGATTEDISNLDIGRYVVTITDANNKTKIRRVNILSEVAWKELDDVSIVNNKITKTGSTGWATGKAVSLNQLLANTNGFVEYKVDELNTVKLLSLTSETNINGIKGLNYALFIYKNQVFIFEDGKYRGYYGHIHKGDKLKIKRVGAEIKYNRNGELLRHIPTDKSKELLIKLALYEQGATFNDLHTNFCNLASITINTIPIQSVIPYSFSFHGQTSLFVTGTKEVVPILSSPITEMGVIAVAATAEYGQLDLLFDITSGQITNLRLIIDSLNGRDTLSLDNNLFKITNDGKELILYESDTTELSTDSLLFGFILQGGLGISPDNDNQFDVLAISGTENITQFNLIIKDKTNNVVFTTIDKLNFWNGQFMGNGNLVPVGAYNYSVEINGTTYDGQILVQY